MFETFRQKLADWIAPELQERRNNAERLMNVDELTGISNRRSFNRAEYRAEQDGKIFIMIDGDNFGAVNKEVGTKNCDEAIRLLANCVRLGAKLADTTRCFRLGGDEFTVIVDTREQAEILIKFVEGFFQYEPIKFGHIRIGATGGHGSTLEKADRKMQIKKKLKKCV